MDSEVNGHVVFTETMASSEGSLQKRRRLNKPSVAHDYEVDQDLFDDDGGRGRRSEMDKRLHPADAGALYGRQNVQNGCGDDDEEENMSFLSSQPFSGGSQVTDWKKWSAEEVAQKLLDFGIPDDAVQKFKDNRIDGRNLDRITERHIKDNLEIRELGTQLKVQEFLERLTFLHPDQTKVFNDPVHGHLELHPLCVAVIDTPEFQRLRYLKQLGASYFVYPGASHNRFEHSLGVCYLAGQLVTALQKRQPGLGITGRDTLCVQIAGLCHDLGHGPFSHIFDNKFMPNVRPNRHWEHEETSIQMFDHLVKENNLEPMFEEYGITAAERVFVKEQIIGKPLTESASGEEMTWYYGRESEKSFLYEIVANKRNGVDVDKWDYFKRDCLHLGIHSGFDHTRFIQFSRVIRVGNELQICVRDKEAFNMYEMFHTRYALHRRAYQHRVVQAVEIMLVEAMTEADKYILTPGKNGRQYTISDCVDDMDAFMQLTDGIFHRILLSDNPKLEKARSILRDIQRRKLYRCVGETKPITATDIIKKNVDVKNEILAELSEQKEEVEQLELDTSSFVVQIVKLDYGKNDKNPVNNLRFFSKGDKNKAKAVRASEVSFMVPQELFKEQLVRLFLRPKEDREADEKCFNLLLDGFQRWCRKNNLSEPKKTSWIELTPCRPDNRALDNNRTPDRPIHMTQPGSAIKTLTF